MLQAEKLYESIFSLYAMKLDVHVLLYMNFNIIITITPVFSQSYSLKIILVYVRQGIGIDKHSVLFITNVVLSNVCIFPLFLTCHEKLLNKVQVQVQVMRSTESVLYLLLVRYMTSSTTLIQHLQSLIFPSTKHTKKFDKNSLGQKRLLDI